MGGQATSAAGGGFRARIDHYLYSGEKKHVLAGIAIFGTIFGVPWYFMTRGGMQKKKMAEPPTTPSHNFNLAKQRKIGFGI